MHIIGVRPDLFDGYNSLGSQAPQNGYPAEVTSDNLFSLDGGTGAFTLSGLVPNQEYQLRFFASRISSRGENRQAAYGVTGVTTETVFLNPDSNHDRTIVATVAADNSGELVVTATAGPDNVSRRGFVYLGAMALSTNNDSGPVLGTDSDGDGVNDNDDAFPNDATETTDTDADGVGDNADAFPTDASETVDTDNDGVGDNADAFPNDSSRSELSTITALPEFPRNSSTLIVELNNGDDRVWNVNPDNDSVSVSDAQGNLLQQVSVGKTPWSLAKSTTTNFVYVTNKGDSSISIVDTQSLSVVNTIVLPSNSQPHGIVFDTNGTHYYVVLEALAVLEKRLVIDNTLVESLALSGTPRHISMTFDGATIYVSNFITPLVPGEDTASVDIANGRAQVFSIDASSFTVGNTIGLTHDDRPLSESQGPGMPNYLSAPVVSFDNRYAYVPSKKDNIDAGTLRGKFGVTFESTVRANTSRIELALETEDNSFRLDHDNSSVATHAALTGDNRYLLVTLETSRELVVYDTQNGFQLMRLPTGRAPQSVALSSDGSQAYVHNFMDRSISRFDLTQMLGTDLPATNVLPEIQAVITEALSADVLLGKQHFYDAADDRLAFDNYLSCASCHKEGKHDGRVWDFGRFGEGLRNTTSLLGKGGLAHGLLHWSGNFDEVQDFEVQIRGLAGGTGLMNDADFNEGTRNQPLGDLKTGLSNDLDALAAYLNSLDEPVLSPLHDSATLSAEAAVGQQLFIDKGCASCHEGSQFTDSSRELRHDVGTLKAASGQRLGQSLNDLDTPSLLGLWTSAPYLHDGSAATVQAAITAHSIVNVNASEANSLTRFLYELPTAPASVTTERLVVEAEDAELSGFFVSEADNAASGGAFVQAPEGSGNFYANNSSTRARFSFNISTAGNYTLEATVRAPDGTSDSFWVKVNGLPTAGGGYLWDTGVTNNFTAIAITHRGVSGPVQVFLEAGENIVTLDLREDGTQIDRLRLVPINSF